MNWCRSCSTDFASVAAFDRHRVGKHDYSYSEGLSFDPPREDGRRCLSAREIANSKLTDGTPVFTPNSRGSWSLAAPLAAARGITA